MDFIKSMIEDALEVQRLTIHKEIVNLHMDMLRQFEQQKVWPLSCITISSSYWLCSTTWPASSSFNNSREIILCCVKLLHVPFPASTGSSYPLALTLLILVIS